MSRAQLSFRFLIGLAFAQAGWSCSAGGSNEPASVGGPGAGTGPSAPGTPGGGNASGDDPGFLLNDDEQAVDGNGNPLNIGSEVACDGVDENQNGIIDDVDKGQDGLCDCLRIGFLGTFASDAGNRTGAFEGWLEERSDVPVTHIAARDPLTPEALGDLQVLVIGNLSERSNSGGYSATDVATLQQWIMDGGGLMSLAGYTNREADVLPTVTLLGPTGLSYDYQGRGPGVMSMGAPPMITRGIVAAAHPSMDGITAMGVYAAYPVVGDGEVIIREGAFNLAMAKGFGAGNVFAFSDEWITQDALWYPMMNRPLTPCQQGCNQCTMQCGSCDQQCADCALQPCEGGQQVPAGEVCRRGCDQGCASCGVNCQTCEQACATCSAVEELDKLDIPRFWLNTMRWLTPANECQVPVPPSIVF